MTKVKLHDGIVFIPINKKEYTHIIVNGEANEEMNINSEIGIEYLKQYSRDNFDIDTDREKRPDWDYYREIVFTERVKLAKETEKDVIGILYSGGFDSTYLMIKYLEEGYTVFPIVNQFNLNSDYDRVRVIIFLRDYVLNILNKKYPGKIIKPFLPINLNIFVGANEKYTQQPTNIFSLYMLPRRFLYRIKFFAMGPVKGDDFCSYQQETLDLYNAVMKFSDHEDPAYIPELKFPIIKEDKDFVIYKINEYMRENKIFLPCISCQNPDIHFSKVKDKYLKMTYHPCGHCHSCDVDEFFRTRRCVVEDNINLSGTNTLLMIMNISKYLPDNETRVKRIIEEEKKDENLKVFDIQDNEEEITNSEKTKGVKSYTLEDKEGVCEKPIIDAEIIPSERTIKTRIFKEEEKDE
ncbi:MAG: hypothetical protein IJ772_04885 [Bacilli bacterium]|nr:hypothetical protein [Bacilli bacterium]